MLQIGKIFNTHRSRYKFHKNSKRDYAWFIGLQDGEVSVPEFIKAIDQQCKGKGFDAFPEAFKFWINCSFRTIDVDGESYSYIHVKTPVILQQYFILSSLFIQSMNRFFHQYKTIRAIMLSFYRLNGLIIFLMGIQTLKYRIE